MFLFMMQNSIEIMLFQPPTQQFCIAKYLLGNLIFCSSVRRAVTYGQRISEGVVRDTGGHPSRFTSRPHLKITY